MQLARKLARDNPEATKEFYRILGVAWMRADHQASGMRGAPAGRSPPSSPGLVRLETSDTRVVSHYAWLREEQQRRRGLHMFKSLSCVGDMLMEERDCGGRRLSRAFLTFTYRPGVE